MPMSQPSKLSTETSGIFSKVSLLGTGMTKALTQALVLIFPEGTSTPRLLSPQMKMYADWGGGSFPNSAPLPPCEVTQVPVSRRLSSQAASRGRPATAGSTEAIYTSSLC